MTDTTQKKASRDKPARSAKRELQHSKVKAQVEGKPLKPGSILTALRRSPLVGADLDLSRPRIKERKIEL